MDNLTHSLVGFVIAKAGAERLSPWATTVCVLAANAPDIDVLTRLEGHWQEIRVEVVRNARSRVFPTAARLRVRLRFGVRACRPDL